MAVNNISEAQFADEVLLAKELVVVDYWADWCSPCKQLAPIIDELAREYENRVKFVKVDTTAEAGLAAQQGILSLPTLQFFQGGQVVKSLSGGKSKNALKKVLDELI